MACPGRIHTVIRHFQKTGTEVTNDTIVELAGGSSKEWGDYLEGPKVQALVRHANLILVEQNKEIVSLGIGKRRWRLVTCAEARIDQAHQQTIKATNHLHNAQENMSAVMRDERAPKKLRADAKAWLQLFEDEQQGLNLLIFEEWADELVAQLPALQHTAS